MYLTYQLSDLLFVDKHGQLGIWDARAISDSNEDEGGLDSTNEGGKNYRLQVHWPATSKSSISSIRFDPLNAHNVSRTRPGDT
jgi:WD repeat-containing protein 76